MSFMRRQPLGVLFDVDGTLVDTSYQHTIAWWQALRDAGLDVPMREIHRAVGMGADMLLPHLIGRDDSSIRTGHDNYFAPFLQQVPAFEDAAELLRACHRLGLTVVLASSSGMSQLERLREAIGADDAIDHVTTADDVDASKPAPDLMHVALTRAKVRPQDAVMVGDTRWDVESAARAGMPCVAVMTGGWDAEELRAAGAAEVWESPSQLLRSLDDSIITRLAARS
jgi:phosphoglycolate phosphatase-like HAD superfamily hydrolase